MITVEGPHLKRQLTHRPYSTVIMPAGLAVKEVLGIMHWSRPSPRQRSDSP